MNLGGRRERKNNLNPHIIFCQAEVQPGLKKATKFKYGLSPTTLYTFIPFCVNFPCDTLAYLGPKHNLRLKPQQGALLEESFQENLRKLKQSSWYDAVLSAKAKPKQRHDAGAKAGFRGLCTELDPRGPGCVLCLAVTAKPPLRSSTLPPCAGLCQQGL